jgi:hypothetical protein
MLYLCIADKKKCDIDCTAIQQFEPRNRGRSRATFVIKVLLR